MGTLVVYVMGSLSEVVIIIDFFAEEKLSFTERFLSANSFLVTFLTR